MTELQKVTSRIDQHLMPCFNAHVRLYEGAGTEYARCFD